MSASLILVFVDFLSGINIKHILLFNFISNYRSKDNLRNYIHINLCISLSIAQLIFITGANKTGSSQEAVPIHCQVIAVFLHYFFLVTFMWMLMEGAFLYLALVKVFLTNTKQYMIGYTVLSYGCPLAYMAILTLPIGFGLPHHQYGHKRA